MQKIKTPRQRLWTVEEYYRIAETGILDPSERVELIEGKIMRMAAKSMAHVIAGRRSRDLLEARLGERVLVWTQDPICLDDYSEPEPDIALIIPPLERYRYSHPTTSDIYLIIEIADTTINNDCRDKSKIYARSGVADYWVLDVVVRQLHVFREPTKDSYKKESIFSENEMVSLLAFPDVNLVVEEML
ncbi:Uma2 family endonuclease [Okeania sp.]|uniref:Uma2 family endonuclease n=1 Tax=Okeania sp. TaxID=3100323 RepID=UPI002B4AD168|nr:Uma2 family endonuclease [Okeania sp.]MEB3342078.1 Uma2 family endonuclease [Okeania sp.]